MRKIKFRAYHKKQKKMYYNVEKTYDYGCNGDNDVLAKSFAEILEDNNYDIMQYTGLKDKNGVKIYEDDIVKINLHDATYLTTKIKWEQRISSFIVKDVCLLDEDVIKRLVVIGNIWENGDLLNDSK